jgi:hypothetical protein
MAVRQVRGFLATRKSPLSIAFERCVWIMTGCTALTIHPESTNSGVCALSRLLKRITSDSVGWDGWLEGRMREPRDVDGHDSWMERRNLTKRVQTWTWEVAGKQTDKQCQLRTTGLIPQMSMHRTRGKCCGEDGTDYSQIRG